MFPNQQPTYNQQCPLLKLHPHPLEEIKEKVRRNPNQNLLSVRPPWSLTSLKIGRQSLKLANTTSTRC